ncbi:MAG: hypothetical protein PVG99_13390 [Desulfobacteraceae bacterium]|jgi:hypothetical protein
MRIYRYIRFVVAIGMLSTLISPASLALTGEPTHEPDVLRNLKGVNVVVENLDPEIERDGLAAGTIRTDSLLRLRQSGIEIVPLKERLRIEGTPYLYVNIRVMRLKPKGYVYGVMVELHEQFVIPRLGSASWVITYRTRGAGGFAYRLPTIRDAARDQLEEFINAYLSVNPK